MTHGPAPDGLHPTPSLLGGGESLTQLPEELHPQGCVDEEQQHEEEAQVAHLWGQRWGWAGRAGWRRGAGRQAPGEGPAEGRDSRSTLPGPESLSTACLATPSRAGWPRTGHGVVLKHL